MIQFSEEHGPKSELDPWRVVLACLFDDDIDSHDIPGIIDAAGLIVD